jgi:O-antigen biosynthesis protein
MQLSVVLLSYNTRELTEQALWSVLAAIEGMSAEVFVVDNASVDGSADMVEEKFPQVHLLRNDSNTGFAAGNNVALREVQGRFVLLLNTDTIVRRNTFECLVHFMEQNPQAGAVGCKILNPDGTLQLDSRRGFPTPVAAFCKMSSQRRSTYCLDLACSCAKRQWTKWVF